MDHHLFEEAQKRIKAFEVVEELVSFQRYFVHDLQLLVDNFREFIKNFDSNNPVIPDSELENILGYLPSLKTLFEDLLCKFESRKHIWTSLPKISDIVVKNGRFHKIYPIYVHNLTKQIENLEKCVYKYRGFAKALKEFESFNKLTFLKYILKPIPRLIRYKSLLQEYLTYLDPQSLDYQDTQEAIGVIDEIANEASPTLSLETLYWELFLQVSEHELQDKWL